MARRRRRTTWRARETWKVGPAGCHYFRRYSASANRDGVRGGFTSHGFRVRVPLLGPVTVNLTNQTVTWDHPGPGAVNRSWGREEAGRR